MKRLEAEDLFSIANGATLLASGGGGSVKTAYSFISELLRQKARVELAELGELREQDTGCVVGAMGSPESFEKIGLNGAESRAIEVINNNIDKPVNFTIPVETGSNLFVAMLAAAKTLEPAIMVDADGAGRSVPTLSCLSYSNEVNATPFALLNAAHGDLGGGDVAGDLLLNLKDTPAPEQANIVEMVARPVLSTAGSFDGIAAIAGWVMNGDVAQQALISGSISKAMQLGQLLSNCESAKDALVRLSNYFSSECDTQLYNLSVSDEPFRLTKLEPFSSGGFDYHRMYFSQGERELIIINQNENLLVWDPKLTHPVTICPDLICMLGKLNPELQREISIKVPDEYIQMAGTALNQWHGLSVEDLKEGQEVYLFSLPASSQSPENRHTFARLVQQFGYYGPYKSVASLNSDKGE